MRVLSVDPGNATGFVLATVNLKPGGRVREIIPESWEELGPKDFARLAEDILRTGRDPWYAGDKTDLVLAESWKPRGGALKFKPEALETIGWLRRRCWELGIRFVNTQDPSFALAHHEQAVAAFPAVGRGGEGHAKMALAHLWGWTQTAQEMEFYEDEEAGK